MRSTLHSRQSTLWRILPLLLSALFCSSLQAHEIRPAIIDLQLGDDGVFSLTQRVNLESLLAGIGAEHRDSDDSDQAGIYRALRHLLPAQLRSRFDDFLPVLLTGSQLSVDGQRVELRLSEVRIPPVGDESLARDTFITLKGSLPADSNGLQWRWAEKFGASVLRVNAADGGELYSGYLQAGRPSAVIMLGDDSGRSEQNSFLDYLGVGFEHILPKGLDHILFVIGLFLLNARFSSLLWQVTSFTLAHTLTLALSIYGILEIPPSVVEPLIAASIVYVCVENIFRSELTYWRPVVVFLFGLLHGMGFAGVLRDIGLAQDRFLTGLIGFNVGVELGQLVVIGGCFLAVGLWFRDRAWYRRVITIPASIIIALIGGYWFLERTLVVV